MNDTDIHKGGRTACSVLEDLWPKFLENIVEATSTAVPTAVEPNHYRLSCRIAFLDLGICHVPYRFRRDIRLYKQGRQQSSLRYYARALGWREYRHAALTRSAGSTVIDAAACQRNCG